MIVSGPCGKGYVLHQLFMKLTIRKRTLFPTLNSSFQHLHSKRLHYLYQLTKLFSKGHIMASMNQVIDDVTLVN
jgi:hypothetical protein